MSAAERKKNGPAQRPVAGKVYAEASDGRELVPKWMCVAAFAVTFTVPNLVFSGRAWFDTLHIMKWFVTMAPIALLSVVAGFRLFYYGAARPPEGAADGRAGDAVRVFEANPSVRFTMDPFSLVWLLLIFLVTAQPIFITMTSYSTYVKEWFFFATMFAVYVIAYNARPGGAFFRGLLWGASLNAALNILFAELQIRDMITEIPFLSRVMPGLARFILSFVMDVPGNYIGNTAQQEMLGLWVAMAILNCVYLHVFYSGMRRSGVLPKLLLSVNLLLMAANACGLWRTTTRGAILALFVGFVVMTICFATSRSWKAVVHLASLAGVVVLFFAIVVAINPAGGTNRGGALVWKLVDIVRNPGSVGGRISIWRVSGEVFMKHPIAGVGLGHYKWHFLDGQGELFRKHPELLTDARYSDKYRWQYTYWAHSEYLQWLCETGLIGTALLAAAGLWWLFRFTRALASRKDMPPDVVWGVAMLFLLFFDALFSRPFHRIENAVWLSLALAQANRFIMPDSAILSRRLFEGGGRGPESPERGAVGGIVYKAFGAFMASAAVCGLIFIGGGMAGDKLLLGAVYASADWAKAERVSRAAGYLMSRDDANEQMANLDISIGERNRDDDRYIRGVGELYAAFAARPNSERLFRLFECARELNNSELMKRLIPYLPPGMVELR